MGEVIEQNQNPVHIGFIMDGNRHWATDNGKTIEEGYRAGADALLETIDHCIDAGVKYMTVYAFSTENWRRPEDQKKVLMKLFEESFQARINDFLGKDVQLKYVGRVTDFPKAVQLAFKASERATAKCKTLVLNAAVSYGGHAEIVDATKRIITSGLRPEELTEEKFAEYIYEAGLPEPEMIVRTSGEKRLSGFMLWQSTYSELYFTDKNWPDFNKEEFDKSLAYYREAKRNFGK